MEKRAGLLAYNRGPGSWVGKRPSLGGGRNWRKRAFKPDVR
jgi:hypothetical protein